MRESERGGEVEREDEVEERRTIPSTIGHTPHDG